MDANVLEKLQMAAKILAEVRGDIEGRKIDVDSECFSPIYDALHEISGPAGTMLTCMNYALDVAAGVES